MTERTAVATEHSITVMPHSAVTGAPQPVAATGSSTGGLRPVVDDRSTYEKFWFPSAADSCPFGAQTASVAIALLVLIFDIAAALGPWQGASLWTPTGDATITVRLMSMSICLGGVCQDTFFQQKGNEKLFAAAASLLLGFIFAVFYTVSMLAIILPWSGKPEALKLKTPESLLAKAMFGLALLIFCWTLIGCAIANSQIENGQDVQYGSTGMTLSILAVLLSAVLPCLTPVAVRLSMPTAIAKYFPRSSSESSHTIVKATMPRATAGGDVSAGGAAQAAGSSCEACEVAHCNSHPAVHTSSGASKVETRAAPESV